MKVGDRIKIYQLNNVDLCEDFPKELEGKQRPNFGELDEDGYANNVLVKDLINKDIYFLPQEIKHVATMVITKIKQNA